MFDIRLLKLREFLLNNLGLNFSESRNRELYDKMEAAGKSFNFEDTDKFIEWLVNNTLNFKQIEKLAIFLTIGETYFFREKKALDYLEFEYLPKLIHERRTKNQNLRIWSAGCATGEEPYSLAIMLRRILPDIKKWNITIKATDINPQFIDKAKKGVYTKWSFRGMSESFKVLYFNEFEKGKYRIKSEIKDMVHFSSLNLISDVFPSNENNTNSFDIILCRNVLIYFSNEGIKYVTSKFYNTLVKGGVMILSPVESNNLVCSKFCRYFNNGVTVYKNQSVNESILKPIFRLNNNNNNKEYKYKNIIKSDDSNNQEKINTEIISNKAKGIQKELLLKECIEEQGGNVSGYYEKALNLFKDGLYDKAEDVINSIINNSDKNNELHLLLARVKYNKQQLEESEKWCLQAIKINKLDAEAHYLLATILFEQGRENDAIASIKRSLFLEPDYVLAYYLLGNIFQMVGDINESKKNFDNALRSLSKLNHEDIIVESDGLTAGRLEEIIYSIKK